MISIYTDGSCLGNPGNGGWAFVLHEADNKKTYKFGYEKETTNNRMELTAAIKAIEYLSDESEFKIITDSNYVKDGINTWIKSWKINNWITTSKKPVKNRDLWTALDDLSMKKKIHWSWVKGHSSNELNNLVDKLARKAAEELIESFEDIV